MKNICIVTGSRAEYGILKPLIMRLLNNEKFNVKIVVTGSHLSSDFGYTYKEILDDGILMDEKIEILLSTDSGVGIAKAMGLAMISFGEYFERSKPDLLILLGDRYECFAVASAATVLNIPIAHIHGGETTEGAYDESFRHSITKMSQLHFASCDEYRKRIIQLGENPDTVFNVGALGIENIKNTHLMTKEELEKSLGFNLDGEYAVFTYHPTTLEHSANLKEEFNLILGALDSFKDLKIIFTYANADNNGRIINNMIDEYVAKNKNRTICFKSLGLIRYLSAVKYSSFVIGNSSSGIIEVPALNKPTINIGDRQKGRLCASSIINCRVNKEEIEDSIRKILKNEIKTFDNPYGDGNTSKYIEEIIERELEKGIELKKRFYDLK